MLDRRLWASRGEALLLDRLQYGVILYGEQGRIDLVNRHAASLLARSRSLTLRGARLYCHDALQRSRLTQLLAGAAAGRGGTLLVSAAGEPPLTLLAVPLASDAPDLDASRESVVSRPPAPCFAVVIGMRDSASSGTLDTFSDLYGLTPAERQVLGELSRDRSPSDIAQSGGVSVRTVRTQLSSIYGKASVAGQRELLAKLLQFPPFALQ